MTTTLWRALAAPLLAAATLMPLAAARADEGAGGGDAGEGVRTDEAAPDVFAAALEALGVTEADLGYRPKATWARYPHPRTVPYVMPFFEDLLANPLDTYAFARTLGNAVEDHLTTEALTKDPTAKDRAETLFRLGVMLGTDRRIGGFRGYSANLTPRPEAEDPLYFALLHLLIASGRPPRQATTFGQVADDNAPRAALRAQVDAVPLALHRPLARFVLDLVDARRWIDRGLRHVTPAQRRAVFGVLETLTEDTPDGTRYHPVLDDVAGVIDEHSLHYGCLKALQATQDARRALGAVPEPADGWGDVDLQVATGWGTVSVATGPGQDVRLEDPLLFVYLEGGNPVAAPVGATGPDRPLSVALLLGDAGRVGWPMGAGVRQDVEQTAGVAAGVLGCGIVYDARDHDTYWKTGRWGLGAGLFGLGALVDEGGDDEYRMRSAGQGAAFFGAGLLLDAQGDDRYDLWEGDGQGFGGPGGIGILADREGNDTYRAEPDAAKAGRGDYHSDHAVAVSNAQGVGSGRRGDGSDGHAWAGGLGALLDVDGDDTYTAGNFSQGLGYWYGTGLLWDGGGNDTYTSVYFTQGSGAHFAVGALIDEGGDDVHTLEHNAGAAFGFGWDVVNAFLLDRGDGNDRYEAKIISSGLAEVRSNAFLLDEGGDDVYVLDQKTRGLGDVDQREGYDRPKRTAPFAYHLGQIGLLLDLGGTDAYKRRTKHGELEDDPDAGDGRRWNVRPREGTRSGFNVAAGIDVDRGRLGFLDPWPARTPPTQDPAPR